MWACGLRMGCKEGVVLPPGSSLVTLRWAGRATAWLRLLAVEGRWIFNLEPLPPHPPSHSISSLN